MDHKGITRGWPPKRRREQAERIRRQKPWLRATGPRTVAGKARVSRNAYKHGFRSPAYKEICRLMRWQRDYVKAVMALVTLKEKELCSGDTEKSRTTKLIRRHNLVNHQDTKAPGYKVVPGPLVPLCLGGFKIALTACHNPPSHIPF